MSSFPTGLREWVAATPWAASLVAASLVLLVAAITFFVVRRVLLRLVVGAIRRTATAWDDILVESGALERAALLAPLAVFHLGLELVPHVPPALHTALTRLLGATGVTIGALTLSALATAGNRVYATFPVARERPIKGYVQILKILLFVVAGVFVLALLMGRSPWVFVTGIGAATAVLLLIFRDTILSLVASIQLVSNDMVRLGDWIEMPRYGANGDVVDVALHTIKVQNWDKTITTIPTYKLIEDSFKNWRGMQLSGGRRIMRALHLDMTSVRFLEPEEVERFAGFTLLRDYVAAKKREIEEYNRTHAEGPEVTTRARRLTNLGTFRAYVAAYLAGRPDIHGADEMTFLVRQLPPGPEGLPLEIYVFTRTTAWAEYEGIQADIFDHLLAILPQFGLRVFQRPTGHDLARWARTSAEDASAGGS